LLDAILVNGYGSQSAAGWTIAYTGTNKRDYKQGTGSNSYYLDIDDSGPTTAKEARMRGYEAMTALGTGTMAFPTSSQSSFGVVCRKSTTADSTARPWYCVADATCFHLFVDTGDYTGPAYSMAFSFGDFFSYKSGDTYNTAIVGRSGENQSSDGYESLPVLTPSGVLNSAAGVAPGSYIDRLWTGVGGSTPIGKMSGAAIYGSVSTSIPTVIGSASAPLSYPNGPDNALELAPLFLLAHGSILGYLKGLWSPMHYQPCGHADTFTGTGNMAGKSFLALNVRSTVTINSNNANGTNAQGQIVVETSNTWS
jgi:hypothetical protein